MTLQLVPKRNIPERIEGDLAWLGALLFVASGVVWMLVLWKIVWPFL
jgi:hypothetical protein